MHTIANTPTAFSPPLTTKTDIYSFGIFAMRLMISTDTPYSQRSMAMLLLYYHQKMGESTGRIADKLSPYHKLDRHTEQQLAGRRWVNYLRMEEIVIKILKVSRHHVCACCVCWLCGWIFCILFSVLLCGSFCLASLTSKCLPPKKGDGGHRVGQWIWTNNYYQVS